MDDYSGHTTLSGKTMSRLLIGAKLPRRRPTAQQVKVIHPSPVEMFILKLAFYGLSNTEIANELKIQEKTVNNRLKAIRQKLHVRTRKQAVAWFTLYHHINAYRLVDPSTYFPGNKDKWLIDEATPIDESLSTPLKLPNR